MVSRMRRFVAGSRWPWQISRRSYSSSRRGSLSGLKINADRLQETLHYTCQWGAAHRYGGGATETGMARLSLSDDDAKVRRWFADEVTRGLGCELSVDEMGNMFARRKGAAANLRASQQPMTAMGSHLDTQPRGGRYDGILGVVAAVEVMKTLQEKGYRTQYDVGIVNWTNEEGARFPMSMMASGVWAGKVPLKKAWNTADLSEDASSSVTVRSELERHGFLGPVSCRSSSTTTTNGYPLGAHFELHIEQGPILESSGKKIGVVQGAQAYRWLTFTITGRDAHTGTTPFHVRSDPLLAAAKMIAKSHELAKNHQQQQQQQQQQSSGALASTGVIKMPGRGSPNTIPSEVTFTLDIRHPEDRVVDELQRQVIASFAEIAAEDGRGVRMSCTLDTDSPAVRFDAACIRAVEDAAMAVVGAEGWLPVTSGAGHDSVYTSAVCPTTMIFVPCRDGVSHHPEEYCSPEDCANGAQVLLDAVVSYDKLRASRLTGSG